MRNCNIFMHDAAPCHQALIVKKWFVENSIYVLENYWVKLKEEVSKQNLALYESLKSAALDAWCKSITPEFCKTLVESMPGRIQAVLQAKSHATKY